MHPRDFEVNRTWLAFRMNQLPIAAGGDQLDIFVLQDAASMFIFGNAFASHGADAPSAAEVEELMHRAWSRRQEWPDELVLPGKPSAANAFVREARRRGIVVRSVPESQMSLYIKDVQQSFEQFSQRGGQG